MTDMWLLYDFADFGCEMPIRANFVEFLGILTPKIVKLLF